jgi:hypothetical protein
MANQSRHVKGLEQLVHTGCTDWPLDARLGVPKVFRFDPPIGFDSEVVDDRAFSVCQNPCRADSKQLNQKTQQPTIHAHLVQFAPRAQFAPMLWVCSEPAIDSRVGSQ